MRQHFCKKFGATAATVLAMTVIFTAGCGAEPKSKAKEETNRGMQQGEDAQTRPEEQLEAAVENTEEELVEEYFSAEELEDVPTVISEYAEKEEFPELAEFLTEYYGVPEEEQTETRYYYNYVDLNEDGRDEIFAIVIGDYTACEAGDSALLLTREDGGTFAVLEDFKNVRTPVTIAENMSNNWHDIIFRSYGKGVETGYLICHYNPEGGYQTELNEFVEELETMSATQILSNNLIDDMDNGRYVTLKNKEQ